MNKRLFVIIVIVAVAFAVIGFIIARVTTPTSSGNASAPGSQAERKILYYKDPMQPWITSDKPGKAADGMDLVPVYEGEASTEPGVVKINPAIVQDIGVTTEPVKRIRLTKTIHAVGRVDYNETRTSILTVKVSGYVEKLYADYVGKPVRSGEPLMEIYSPDLVAVQEEYLRSLDYQKSLSSSNDPAIQKGAAQLVGSTRKRLLYWDITEEQIKGLENSGAARKTLTLYSPVNGVVVEKDVYEGMKISAGMNLAKVADLSTVWVTADVYAYELPWAKIGDEAVVNSPYNPGISLKGRVLFIYPFIQEDTRTAKVRLEFPNPGLLLKPAMYVDVNIKSSVSLDALVVPEQAVIRTGTRDVVVVSRGGGYFKPVDVKLGVLAGGYYQILSGLQDGETIVTSSQFLIDSESNLKAALAGMTHQHGGMPGGGKETPQQASPSSPEQQHEGAMPPMPGMSHPASPSSPEQQHESAMPPMPGMSHPASPPAQSGHQHKPATPPPKKHQHEAPQPEASMIDPVCGMTASPEFEHTYQGKKYNFCSNEDMEKFKANPEKYVKK